MGGFNPGLPYSASTAAPPASVFDPTAPYAPQPGVASKAEGLSPQPAPTGMLDRFAKWTDAVANDIKNGTDTTGVGTVLKKMGAHGVYAGEPHAVGDFMASMPLGLLQGYKGGAELGQGKVVQGAEDVVGGGLKEATMPAALGSPIEAEAGTEAATKVVQGIKDLPPSVRIGKAAANFNDLTNSIGAHTVAVTDKIAGVLEDLKDAVDTGSNQPSVINKFVTRIADTDQAPLTYKEARQFYSNVSDLSASDRMAANGKMQRLLIQFKQALGDAISTTADSANRLDQYQSAMKGYAKGMGAQDRLDAVKSFAKKAAITGAIGATGLGVGGTLYKGYQEIMGAGQ